MGISSGVMSDRLSNHGLIMVCTIRIGAPQHWQSIAGRTLTSGIGGAV